jgi:Spy/CpxP family protein refolding chaperone
MPRIIEILITLIVFPLIASFQTKPSPYAGQDRRAIKALSSEDIQTYLEGRGMGLAKAAELNHYPGPRHVLDLAAELQLSHALVTQTQKIYDTMHNNAVKMGKLIIEKERQLDSLYATQKISELQLRSLVGEIAGLQGELRLVHLKAHLEMKKILSPQQVAKYDELRGYEKGSQQHFHGKH